MFAPRARCEHRAMDTISTLPHTGHASFFTDEVPHRGIREARKDASAWHRLTHDAVVMAWARDPDVLCDLVATLLDIHLHHCNRVTEDTLDELHLMVALELQELDPSPD
jgi:hypothetical protein